VRCLREEFSALTFFLAFQSIASAHPKTAKAKGLLGNITLPYFGGATKFSSVTVQNSNKKSPAFFGNACHPCAGAMLIFSVSFQVDYVSFHSNSFPLK
jgi:hypothetical protein